MSKSTLPKHVRVLGQDFSVTKKKLPDNYQGFCISDKNAIEIADYLTGDSAFEVMMHECLHAMFGIIGITDEIGMETEEKIIQRLSPTLMAFLRDNKLSIYKQ